jgi:hypothetical protein
MSTSVEMTILWVIKKTADPFARDDKGEAGVSMESSCLVKAVFFDKAHRSRGTCCFFSGVNSRFSYALVAHHSVAFRSAVTVERIAGIRDCQFVE